MIKGGVAGMADMNTSPVVLVKLSSECSGDCPCGCGKAAYPYSVEGADGYVDASRECAPDALVDAGLIDAAQAAEMKAARR